MFFTTGKSRLLIVQITDQFKFFTIRFLSRQIEEDKFVLTNKIFFVTSIQSVASALRENLSNRSSGVQIPRDICTRFGSYLYSTKCSWIVSSCYCMPVRSILFSLNEYPFAVNE